MAFGTPKYSNGGGFIKYKTLKDGEVITGRFVPPIGELAESGTWMVFHACHFGYNVRQQQDPTKTYPKLWKCPMDKDFRSGIVKVPCRECNKIADVADKIEALRAECKSKNMPDDETKMVLAPYIGWKTKHNRDSKWYMLFLQEDGELVVVLLSNDTKKKILTPLLAKIAKTEETDPLLSGVVFELTALGKQLDKADQINPVMITHEVDVNGKKVKVQAIKRIEWTEAEERQVTSRGINLLNPDRFITISQDQIKLLVNSSGDPEETETILNFGSKVERAPKSENLPAMGRVVTSPPAEKSAVEAPKPVAEPVVEDDEEAKLVAQLAAARAKKAAALAAALVVAQAAVAETPKPTAPVSLTDGFDDPPATPDISDVFTDEDFINQITKKHS